MGWHCDHGTWISCDWHECGLCCDKYAEQEDRYTAIEESKRQTEMIAIQSANSLLLRAGDKERSGDLDSALASLDLVEPATEKQRVMYYDIKSNVLRKKGEIFEAAKARTLACSGSQEEVLRAYSDAIELLLGAPESALVDKTGIILEFAEIAERRYPGKAIRFFVEERKIRGLDAEFGAICEKIVAEIRKQKDAEEIENFARENERRETEEKARMAAQIQRQEKLESDAQKKQEEAVKSGGCTGCGCLVVGVILAYILSFWSFDKYFLIIVALFVAVAGGMISYLSKRS